MINVALAPGEYCDPGAGQPDAHVAELESENGWRPLTGILQATIAGCRFDIPCDS